LPSFLLTIDVEDWFQVENFRPWIPFSTWDSRELRVEANVHKLLDLFDDVKLDTGSRKPEAGNSKFVKKKVLFASLDSINLSNPTNSTNSTNSINSTHPTNQSLRATFFILGWIAKRLPHLVREIAARGHEVASHGFNHQMCARLPEEELRKDFTDSKRLLEDITGTEVAGFRAPNFSVGDRVLSILQEAGYRYDSSYNNFSLHGRYGKLSLNGHRAGIAHKLSENFFELPISNFSISSFPILGNIGILAHFRHSCLPWGGGAYFRLIPLSMFAIGVRSILKNEGAYIFYMHPWEIDYGQPKVQQASVGSKFKHFKNISKTETKLRSLLERLSECRFVTCWDYINFL
jgi:peptidoglycan-N-acetylglucosamine deacetylase